MAISAYNGQPLVLRIKPTQQADTLAELNAAPESYEGEYVRVLDQSAGADIYTVFEGAVLPAFEQAGYEARPDAAANPIYNGVGATLANMGEVVVTVSTGADGVATIHPTDDGTETGVPLFSTIHHVAATALGIMADAYDNAWCGSVDISDSNSNPTTVDVQMLTGKRSVFLLGAIFAAPNIAAANTDCQIRIVGELA